MCLKMAMTQCPAVPQFEAFRRGGLGDGNETMLRRFGLQWRWAQWLGHHLASYLEVLPGSVHMLEYTNTRWFDVAAFKELCTVKEVQTLFLSILRAGDSDLD